MTWWLQLAFFILLCIIAAAAWEINEKLGRLLDIVHRIRINDRDSDF